MKKAFILVKHSKKIEIIINTITKKNTQIFDKNSKQKLKQLSIYTKIIENVNRIRYL